MESRSVFKASPSKFIPGLDLWLPLAEPQPTQARLEATAAIATPLIAAVIIIECLLSVGALCSAESSRIVARSAR
jgi:hypothetical protein